MRKLLQKLLTKPVIWLANKWSSRPDKARVFKSLTDLHQEIIKGNTKKGLIIPFDIHKDKFIILSDQHKGAKNDSDDFMPAEKNYLAALDYYYAEGYLFINLGDCEELCENTWTPVKKCNTASFEKEKLFVQ